MTGRGRRRGFNLIGLVILILALGVTAIVLSNLARQARRSSHWFCDAQQAHDLADAGLKQVVALLAKVGDRNAAQAAGPLGPALVSILDALSSAGDAGTQVVVLSSDRISTLPDAVDRLLSRLGPFSPKLEVVVKVVAKEPLWSGLLDGLPPDPREKKGRIRIIASASVVGATGIRESRSIVMEKEYKQVCVLPSLLGRFALFVQDGPGKDPNFVKLRFDPVTGDSAPEALSPLPLIVRSESVVRLVDRRLHGLDRSAIVTGIQEGRFLDRQGWVYLGGAEGKTWKLRLAHGYGEYGESPLLPGWRFRALFKGQASEDGSFAKRFKQAFDAEGPCKAEFVDSTMDGLHHFHHGFASNYELIGQDPAIFPLLQTPQGQRLRVDLGPGETSCLRLFGSPDGFSPTLVFGPVDREFVRRAWIQTTTGPSDGPCPHAGGMSFPLFRLPDHGPGTQRILLSAFGSAYAFEECGTAPIGDAFVRSLPTVLDPRGSGFYAPNGMLVRSRDVAQPRRWSSELLPWLGEIPDAGGTLPEEAVFRLYHGDLPATGSDPLYVGRLENGFRAFQSSLKLRVVRAVTPKTFRKEMLSGTTLRLPGVVLVQTADNEPLVLGPIDSVKQGGLLVTAGPITIAGNILRNPSTEPLTLVSLKKDIVIKDEAAVVEAYLVALCGKVRFPAGDLTLFGGMACRELDLDTLKNAPARRLIRHATKMDPAHPAATDYVRVFYGREARMVVGGERP